MAEARTAAVLGLGASGEAAARLLRDEGWTVSACDADPGAAMAARAAALRVGGIAVRVGPGAAPEGDVALAVVSPGIPVSSPWIAALRARGVPTVSELEVGWSRHRGRSIAVTGSNGKSTAVKWLAEALAAAGRRAAITGNYGPPVSAVVRTMPPPEWLVIEASSFQLETVDCFRPDVGVLMNVHPNHLDRHGDIETYRALKWRLFARMTARDIAIVPAAMRREAADVAARVRTFGAAAEGADYAFDAGRVRHAGRTVLDVRGTWFDNPVHGLAAAAVAAAIEACGVDPAAAERAARVFEPLPHRMARVAEIAGVRYIDDSKSTNLAAMEAAVRMTDGPVRLIAGGLTKGEDYRAASKLLAERVVKVYLIGSSEQVMADAWSSIVPCARCGRIEDAFECARREAVCGDVVLLSPACASFDQFRNYAERGERFARLAAAAAAAAK